MARREARSNLRCQPSQYQLAVEIDAAIGPRGLGAVRWIHAVRPAEHPCLLRLALLRRPMAWDACGEGWERSVSDVQRAALETGR